MDINITDKIVIFTKQDMPFLQKFGPVKAADMALTFQNSNPELPFLYDTYQLAYFLNMKKKVYLIISST